MGSAHFFEICSLWSVIPRRSWCSYTTDTNYFWQRSEQGSSQHLSRCINELLISGYLFSFEYIVRHFEIYLTSKLMRLVFCLVPVFCTSLFFFFFFRNLMNFDVVCIYSLSNRGLLRTKKNLPSTFSADCSTRCSLYPCAVLKTKNVGGQTWYSSSGFCCYLLHAGNA